MSKILAVLVLLTFAHVHADQDSYFPVPASMLARQEPMQNPSESAETESKTIVAIISYDPSLTTFSKAVKAADLSKTLQGDGPFTIFASNDLAFAKLSPNKLNDLMKNKDRLAKIVTLHIVPGKLMGKDIKTMKAKTVNGKPLDIKVKDGIVTVNNAKVVKSDIEASNGVIHVIDTVLIP